MRRPGNINHANPPSLRLWRTSGGGAPGLMSSQGENVEKTGTIHYAKFEESDRLQRVLQLMLDGRQRTTREISRGADVEAVNSAACELRENGFDLVCLRRSRPAIYQLLGAEAAHCEATLRLAKKRTLEAA